MKDLMTALRFKVFMIILLGLVYPLAMTGIAKILLPAQSKGSFLEANGQVVGSALIGQNFSKPENFWSRPSATEYNPLPSGGSNLGQQSEILKKLVEVRRKDLRSANPDQIEDPPQDLLFSSGSGLDPHISIEAAQYQLNRVAKHRNLDVEVVKRLIEQSTHGRQWGIFGEPTVNVLKLNLSLNQLAKNQTSQMTPPSGL